MGPAYEHSTSLVVVTAGPDFEYSDLLPLGDDDTPYRLVATEGVSAFEADGQTFLRSPPTRSGS